MTGNTGSGRGDLTARGRDDLEAYVDERAADDPDLPALLDAAVRRRELFRAMADERRARGLPRNVIAARMGTSEAVVARLEAGEVDPRLSTIERFATGRSDSLPGRHPRPDLPPGR